MSTELRQYIKTNYTGSNLTILLHPLTNNADPITLKLTPEQIAEKLEAGLISEVVDDGTKQNIDSKVDYDLANASTIYQAFSIDEEDLDKVTLLGSAIDNYGISLEVDRDDTQIIKDTTLAAIDLIKIKAMDAATVQANYVRSSAGSYTITTEVIATQLGLTYTGETTDNDLAQLIVDEVVPTP